jgi:uncharacterized protein YkwD
VAIYEVKFFFLQKGVSRMRTFGRIATGIAAAAFLAVVNTGCSQTPPPAPQDTWTAADNSASQSASRAEVAARRAEDAAARVEASAQRCEAAAERIEAMVNKGMRK